MKPLLRLVIPHLPLSLLGRIGAWSALGALVAGVYGVVHDQVTFTLAPEYFTRLKFGQFAWVDWGWPDRVRVGIIGILATWWVGFLGTWLHLRVARPWRREVPLAADAIRLWRVMFCSAIAGGLAGGMLGPPLLRLIPAWSESLMAMGVTDAAGFGQVAGIHWGGYLGALAGWLAALIRLATKRADRRPLG
jgi:hypothetical protein